VADYQSRDVPILSVREAMMEAVVSHESFVPCWKFWCCYAADVARSELTIPVLGYLEMACVCSEDPVGYDYFIDNHLIMSLLLPCALSFTCSTAKPITTCALRVYLST
jgi:hypothetical protein